MLDHFHRQYNVEALVRSGQLFGSGGAVVDRNAGLLGVRLGGRNVFLGRIGADHPRAQARERLRKNAAAAADIEHAQVLEAVELLRIATKARRRLIADIGEPDRIELVQRRHGPARIPPIRGKARETLNLGLIDAGYTGFSGNHSNTLAKSLPAIVAGGSTRRYVIRAFWGRRRKAKYPLVGRLLAPFGAFGNVRFLWPGW